MATGIVCGSVKVWCPLISYEGVCLKFSALRLNSVLLAGLFVLIVNVGNICLSRRGVHPDYDTVTIYGFCQESRLDD